MARYKQPFVDREKYPINDWHETINNYPPGDLPLITREQLIEIGNLTELGQMEREILEYEVKRTARKRKWLDRMP